jgi:hypothetical protein
MLIRTGLRKWVHLQQKPEDASAEIVGARPL